ncbi:DNA cytosine methyltransferase [Actinoplanes regularis]|uniref:DNA cytosine methyltransferase n=1 Tax=Actinoplanes regularis TaxID=52697 RepID=UPI0024A13F68|nr:DNA cytosine methyltransferase [Actinoplanes regularis]GLW31890.1 DNA cytosine methyltransferase [Actinoplanes regularis]
MSLRVYDEFSGVGGTSCGWSLVPYVDIYAAANHAADAVASHALNFPAARHFQEDVTKLPVDKMPYAEIFVASPACPAWTTANGVKREFDKANAERQALFDAPTREPTPKQRKRLEEYKRSRLLMKEIPRYLRAMADRGRPVLAGMVENVIQVRLWHEWDDWIAEFRKLDYDVRVIAFNSMHAQPVRARRAPQSRNRAFIAYWHKSLGRRPDFDKWLRPAAWCPSCDQQVLAVQVWKKPGRDMGAYGTQYIYLCPKTTCRGREVFPETLPALAAIDPTIPGLRIGDRHRHGLDPLEDATLDRIREGVRRYWAPLMVPVEGRDGKHATPASTPMRTQTCRNETGYALPPFLAPAGGTWRTSPSPGTRPMPTRTTRECDGVATPPLPFITPLRGGGDKHNARPATAPLSTVTASGNHHGLALPPLVTRQNTGSPGSRTTPATQPVRTVTASGRQSVTFAPEQMLLVPYYGTADYGRPVTEPIGTLPTRDRYGLAHTCLDEAADVVDLDDVLFRMLEPHEIARAMAFEDTYQVAASSKRAKVRLYGNAVTPPVAELIGSALVECITGVQLDRHVGQDPAV